MGFKSGFRGMVLRFRIVRILWKIWILILMEIV